MNLIIILYNFNFAFFQTLTVAKEGPDIEDLVLLQTFLGVSTTIGVFIAGTILRKTFRIGSFLITSQIVSQVRRNRQKKIRKIINKNTFFYFTGIYCVGSDFDIEPVLRRKFSLVLYTRLDVRHWFRRIPLCL